MRSSNKSKTAAEMFICFGPHESLFIGRQRAQRWQHHGCSDHDTSTFSNKIWDFSMTGWKSQQNQEVNTQHN